MEDKMAQDAFTRTLANFMHDFASGDAVRHLADQGFTVTEIMERLTFPTKKETVAKMVWQHYLDRGTVLTEPPKSGVVRQVSYVQDHGRYGRVSMRQEVREVEVADREYVPCSFGKEIYRDRKGFEKKLERLSSRDREYILDLPWPLATVWHVADERMKRICEALEE
ncbi:MAG: hypothetical protein IJR36_08555 [Lachnospiraceae bacterium]|nr:hypothetical protein [Lachnospiraceae bacterium]